MRLQFVERWFAPAPFGGLDLDSRASHSRTSLSFCASGRLRERKLERSRGWFRAVLGLVLLASVCVFVVSSWRWPLVGDASLMHYVIFLLDRGAAPYRDIAEMNMPGSYLAEWAAMHSFGGGELAWRLFDLALCLLATLAMAVIATPVDWAAGVWAGALFLLIHGRDGIQQLGQRDLTLTVCLLCGYAFLFAALRRERTWMALPFGLLAGFAVAVKPTLLPLGPLALLLAAWQLRRTGKPVWRLLLTGAAGLLLCWLCIGYFLWREGAVGVFATTIRDMVAYHAQLGRRGAGYLLLHSFSPLMPLLLGWLFLLAVRPKRPDRCPNWERIHLAVALGIGLLSYLSQGKGYPYQRYPFLAFLLLLLAIDFAAALRERGLTRVVGAGTLAYGVLILATVSAYKAGQADGANLGTVGLLRQDLQALPPADLSGGVQCIDSIVGCTNVLYRMRLVETSLVFYDEFLFGPATMPAVRENRDRFWKDLQRKPPKVIVVTAPLFPDGPDNYAKLALWPQFDSYLRQRYSLLLQRTPNAPVKWWSRIEVPSGYRIYIRNP